MRSGIYRKGGKAGASTSGVAHILPFDFYWLLRGPSSASLLPTNVRETEYLQKLQAFRYRSIAKYRTRIPRSVRKSERESRCSLISHPIIGLAVVIVIGMIDGEKFVGNTSRWGA